MKINLRHLTAVMFVILVTVSGAIAQESKMERYAFNRKRTFEALELCLNRSDVPGFVESALYTVAECKSRYPDLDYSHLLRIVDKVAREDGSPSIRYKAYLVSMYLSKGSDIQVKAIRDADNHEYLFKQIADQLEQRFLAFRGDVNVEENK